MEKLKVIGIDIFLEKRKTRVHVGELRMVENQFVFTYDDNYFAAKNIIPLGPEFPLTQKIFMSNTLFPSLEDRIPSRQNPAYPEYCKMMNIHPDEKDPFILLSTIGRKGPSSFIFSPLYQRSITLTDIIHFRESLGLTTREFARVFEFSQASINALERGRTSGKDLLKRLDLLLIFPEVVLHFLFLNGGYLDNTKWTQAVREIKRKQNETIE